MSEGSLTFPRKKQNKKREEKEVIFKNIIKHLKSLTLFLQFDSNNTPASLILYNAQQHHTTKH
jgi:hypothetical protein